MFDTVAISDHDLERRNLLYEALTELNYRVTTVPSHRELRKLLDRERPHYLILAAEPLDPTRDSALSEVERAEPLDWCSGPGPEPSRRAESSASSLVETIKELRAIDRSLRLIVLAPSKDLEHLTHAVVAEPGVSLLDAQVGRLELIRSILSILKARTVELVNRQPAFQEPILIVEDEPGVALLLTEYLQYRGYHTTSVKTGEEALTQMRVVRPKVVLLDLLLPGMDGLLTLQRLKAIDHSVIVIVATGVMDTELMHKVMQLGASAYFAKPFDLAKLEATILTSLLA